MSLAAQRCTMRTSLERNTGAPDAFGSAPGAGTWTVLNASASCLVLLKIDQQFVESTGQTVAIETFRCYVPKSTDVKVGDRLNLVKDRSGNVLFNTIFRVQAVAPRSLPGGGITHQELILQRWS